MTILSDYNNAKKAMEERGWHIFKIASDLHYESEYDGVHLIPHMSNTYIEVSAYDEPVYTPPYEPKKVVAIKVEEHEDAYDDFGTESYTIRMPEDLFLNGTFDELKAFIKCIFDKECDRIVKLNNEQNYSNLFKIDREKALAILNHPKYNEGIDEYLTRNDIFLETGIEVFDRRESA